MYSPRNGVPSTPYSLIIDQNTPNPYLQKTIIYAPKVHASLKTIDKMNNKDAVDTIKHLKVFGTDNISNYFLKLAMPYIKTLLPTSSTYHSNLANSQMIGKPQRWP